MSVGKYTYGEPIVHWRNPNAKLTIGKFCSIAANVNIYLGGNHRTDWVTTYPFGHIHQNIFNAFKGEGHPATKGDVTIGNDVWIGSNVTIMSGVTIGDGAVIANNSHVVKNVEPYTIVGGNPARHIKYRFTPEQIQNLLKIQWWNWSDDKINRYTPLLCNPTIDNFIEEALKDMPPKPIVGFFIRHFGERGTEIAVYDYADCNETLLQNKSICFHFPKEKTQRYGWPYVDEVFEKFKQRFQMVEIQEFAELNGRCVNMGVSVLYMQTAGVIEQYPFIPPVTDVPYAIHCVFTTKYKFGDYYFPISDSLNTKDGTQYPVVPYMIRVHDTQETMRKELGIPEDAIIFGRYGGLNQFDCTFAQEAVQEVAKNNSNIYFLFMNTQKFCEETETIRFLPREIRDYEKRKFINTCDAFLHGRMGGETFGLAIGEFAICDKPIFTLRSDVDNAHLDILGKDAIVYHDKESLVQLLTAFTKSSHDMSTNGYKKYTPDIVMQQFATVLRLAHT